MRKEIKIGDITITAQSSAFTPFAYRNFTGRELLKDLMQMQEALIETQKDESKAPEVVSTVLNQVLELAFVMNQEADSTVKDFPTWLKQFEGILENTDWLTEVIGTAGAIFRRGS